MPQSRWEEDSEEEEDADGDVKSSDVVNHLQETGVVGLDPSKRTDSAIFRRAISAIKPKVIEIKLRPERRVLLDSSLPSDKGVDVDADLHGGVTPEALVNLRTALPLVPKFNPALVDLKIDVDEKKKSVRDRLGDKVEPDQPSKTAIVDAKSDEPATKSKDKKDSSSKKDKRSSPSKDKVSPCIERVSIELKTASSFGARFILWQKDRKEEKRDKEKRSKAKDKDKKHKRKEDKKSKEDKEKKDDVKSLNQGDTKPKSNKTDDKSIGKKIDDTL